MSAYPDTLAENLWIRLEPSLNLHRVEEEAQVGPKRVVVFFRLHGWRDSVF